MNVCISASECEVISLERKYYQPQNYFPAIQLQTLTHMLRLQFLHRCNKKKEPKQIKNNFAFKSPVSVLPPCPWLPEAQSGAASSRYDRRVFSPRNPHPHKQMKALASHPALPPLYCTGKTPFAQRLNSCGQKLRPQ